MTTVEKKSVVKERHSRVISKFERWARNNPDATLDARIKRFDAICDQEVKKK